MDEYRAMMNDGSLCQKQDEIREYVKAPGGGGRVVSFLVQVGRILEGPISGQHGSTESKTSTGLPGEEPWYWNRRLGQSHDFNAADALWQGWNGSNKQ